MIGCARSPADGDAEPGGRLTGTVALGVGEGSDDDGDDEVPGPPDDVWLACAVGLGGTGDSLADGELGTEEGLVVGDGLGAEVDEEGCGLGTLIA